MRLTKFDSLPGSTPLEKLTLWSGGDPICTQQKFNGISATYFPDTYQLVTRDNKYWDMNRFPTIFTKELKTFAGRERLHGELLYSGESLQAIAGLVSVNGLKPIPEEGLRFMVYDLRMPDLSFEQQPFSERLTWMEDRGYDHSFVLPVSTYYHSPEQACNFYDRMITEGQEGCVYRIDPCYDAGLDTAPNPHAVKRKALHEAEGICIGFTEGKGKRVGMLGSLIVQLHNGVRLSVGGGKGLSDECLRDLYLNPPYGETITYTYEELSANGTPLRPQFKAVRSRYE